MPAIHYSAKQVARWLDFPVGRLRAYVRSGLIGAARGTRGELCFSFQDVVLLRTAKGLFDAHISPQRVRKALRKLREQLPSDAPLTGVNISAESNRIVVRDGRTSWHPESGQALLDFSVSDLAAHVTPLEKSNHSRPPSRQGDTPANAWYEQACQLEATSPREAASAYRKAIAQDPNHAPAHVNLGRILHEQGDFARAEEHYRRGLSLEPEDAIAAFNLGVALEDQKRFSEAIECYKQALGGDPNLQDAHYNLAHLFDRLGRSKEALRHLQAYHRLTRGS